MATRLLSQGLPARWTSKTPRRLVPNCRRYHRDAAVQQLLKLSPEVADAVATNKPVVALESTIYTHGALGAELPGFLEDIVRQHGAVPAVCGVLAGVPTVGLTALEVERMVNEGARKLSRRDLAYMVGMGMAGQKMHGGTTIAGTMVLARLAGIRVFGTGGLGGVHQGGQDSLDVSADLTELGRTRVAVVSSGCKGFLDIPRTLEYLETQGAMVSTFADGRTGNVDFPAFWVRESGSKSPFVVQDEAEAAAIILAQEQLGIESGMLFANPIPAEHAIPRQEMEAAIASAVREADEKGFHGARNTPYILTRIRELTQERSTVANKYLVQSNVARAANVAVELSKLLGGSPGCPETVHSIQVSAKSTPSNTETKPAVNTVGILVAGSVALDLSCDFAGSTTPSGAPTVSPALHTSNPSHITQSVGGVGHNVALAAHRVSPPSSVRLCSMIGTDIAGSTILTHLAASGLDTAFIRQLGHEYPSTRTAQYIAVNDADKNLVLAMADMAILSSHSFPKYWASAVAASKPKWLVLDANWAAPDLRSWIASAKSHGAKIAFEPVSAVKSERLFCSERTEGVKTKLGIYPNHSVDLATPNQFELAAMHEAATRGGYFEGMAWFEVIDKFGMRGARERFVKLTSAEMTDEGVPVQSVRLLPYVPRIITKMGANGALLTELLPAGDARLRDPKEARYILARAPEGSGQVGGVYMRLYKAAERVEDVVSVNGVGDTFLGVLVAGLARGGRVEELVDVAQRAAVLTLRSRESVSEDLGGLRAEVERVVAEGQRRG
ncbi:hypothetical protein OQA88_3672 [Cercophora sp. LCS_1]